MIVDDYDKLFPDFGVIVIDSHCYEQRKNKYTNLERYKESNKQKTWPFSIEVRTRVRAMDIQTMIT